MESGFFNNIVLLDFAGNLQLTIGKSADNGLVVSILLRNESCGDSAKDLIPPLTLMGTAEELDEGFFAQIAKPVEQVSGLLVDMEAFLVQMEIAKKNSAMEKQQEEMKRKRREAKEKKYKEVMDKVDALEKEGKFRDAWTKLPDPAEFPEQAELIRKRKSELSTRFAPDLFGATASQVHNVSEQVEEESDPNDDADALVDDGFSDEEE
ncbi:PRTRC system protein E [Sphingobacterium deserti]|uniref:Prtrc system protein E n=1 Tax=Sphingobacterium deserti TaxID=1229276 RepID=A0A0B8SZ76_9SPHI|nr:PRTRC system protein E [Sphingobacterium deserti]KGE12661.1 prtrc system protein E [Sphingobacterium deserti]